jgi:hypothetical protein
MLAAVWGGRTRGPSCEVGATQLGLSKPELGSR